MYDISWSSMIDILPFSICGYKIQVTKNSPCHPEIREIPGFEPCVSSKNPRKPKTRQTIHADVPGVSLASAKSESVRETEWTFFFSTVAWERFPGSGSHVWIYIYICFLGSKGQVQCQSWTILMVNDFCFLELQSSIQMIYLRVKIHGTDPKR